MYDPEFKPSARNFFVLVIEKMAEQHMNDCEKKSEKLLTKLCLILVIIKNKYNDHKKVNVIIIKNWFKSNGCRYNKNML